MNLAQSPHVPKSAKRPRFADIPWLVAFCVRGLGELVRARIVFGRLEAKGIPNRNNEAKAEADKKRASKGSVGPSEATLARIAFVIPRISDRLPWRSDCMVQAIAGQNWLSSMDAYGEIQIGVENPADGKFGAHAWLMHGESVVTGGDISRYAPILTATNHPTMQKSEADPVPPRADSTRAEEH